MFTGLIEAVQPVKSNVNRSAGRRISIPLGNLAGDAAPGDSICVNGVCFAVNPDGVIIPELGGTWYTRHYLDISKALGGLSSLQGILDVLNRAINYCHITGVGFVDDLICELMDEQGIKKAELASKLGTSRSHITQLLSGTRNMTLRTASDVLHALGRSLHVSAERLAVGQQPLGIVGRELPVYECVWAGRGPVFLADQGVSCEQDATGGRVQRGAVGGFPGAG